jgi:hypothetical protein
MLSARGYTIRKARVLCFVSCLEAGSGEPDFCCVPSEPLLHWDTQLFGENGASRGVDCIVERLDRTVHAVRAARLFPLVPHLILRNRVLLACP